MRPVFGTTTITTAGTEQQITASAGIKVKALLFKARVQNTGYIYVGHSSAVTATNGLQLSAGESVSMDFGEKGTEHVDVFYVDCSVNGERVDWVFIYEI